MSGGGDVLLLYTDGLVERRGEDIDVSLDRLARLRLHPGGDLGGLVDRILSLLVREPAEDDIAVLGGARHALGRREDASPGRRNFAGEIGAIPSR